MYPAEDVPVVQLGIDTARSGEYHYEFAKRLGPLRDEGVLVLGSGNIAHNLALWDGRDPRPLDWAIRFDGSVKRRIAAREHIELVDWQRLGEDARKAIPTPEHYLPLLYVLALQRDGDRARFFNEEVAGPIAMTSVVIEPAGATAASAGSPA